MLKRENIKQAIDAISERAPEIGYSLNEMLGSGQIDVPLEGDDLYFLFDKEKVLINKFLYFNEGTVPIEQGLLIKYGEMIKKQELQNIEHPPNYMQAAKEIQKAGLKLMVTHEIDYALTRLRDRPGRLETKNSLTDYGNTEMESVDTETGLIPFLKKIKKNDLTFKIDLEAKDSSVLYQGVVGDTKPAYFMGFPFCMDSLMQVADMNLEFFHVRFLLNCLSRGTGKNLFVCLMDGKIFGLVYLMLKERTLYKGLEIRYIATLGGKISDPAESIFHMPRGVGAFLVAGVWMLWKTRLGNVNEISLDSEIGARRFYEAVGFKSRGLSGYVLKDPKGYLLRAILIMANNYRELRKSVVEEIGTVIEKQAKLLRRKAKNEKEQVVRSAVIASIKECLKSEAHPEFVRVAIGILSKYKKKIPESEGLIRFASEHGALNAKAPRPANRRSSDRPC
jgi:hypothetical protein